MKVESSLKKNRYPYFQVTVYLVVRMVGSVWDPTNANVAVDTAERGAQNVSHAADTLKRVLDTILSALHGSAGRKHNIVQKTSARMTAAELGL